MRPGQSCPGVAIRASWCPSERCGCFNEAGAIMPRSGCPTALDRTSAYRCFNEAGAIMPRSGDSSEARHDERDYCFNEAGAIMPRSGSCRASHSRRRARPASMRPGQSCPGVAAHSGRSSRRSSGFNEAGAIMPRSGAILAWLGAPRTRRFNEAGAIMPRSGAPFASDLDAAIQSLQ